MKLSNSFVIVLVVLSCILANTTSQSRIQGGSDWDIANSPYVVSIHDKGYHCTGALISMRMVATVAHCVIKIHKDAIRVGAGVSDLGKLRAEGHVREAQEVHYPHNLNRETFDIDIAVVELSESFPEIPNKIDKIELCETSLNRDIGMQVRAWGSTILGARGVARTLQSATFSIIPKSVCAHHYVEQGLDVSESKICAGSREARTCNGDSGGPAVVDGRLCAMVSSMVLSAPNIPTLFTNINNVNVRNFIDNLLRN